MCLSNISCYKMFCWSQSIVLVENPRFFLLQLESLVPHALSQVSHNLEVILLINCPAHWYQFNHYLSPISKKTIAIVLSFNLLIISSHVFDVLKVLHCIDCQKSRFHNMLPSRLSYDMQMFPDVFVLLALSLSICTMSNIIIMLIRQSFQVISFVFARRFLLM